jgi:hypothetical protein
MILQLLHKLIIINLWTLHHQIIEYDKWFSAQQIVKIWSPSFVDSVERGFH